MEKPKEKILLRVIAQLARSKKVTFVMIGVFAAAIGLLLMKVLVDVLQMNENTAYGIQTLFTLQVVFVPSYYVTWNDRATPFWAAWLAFHKVRAITIALSVALFGLLVYVTVPYLMATILTALAITLINFIATDKLVFKPLPTNISSSN